MKKKQYRYSFKELFRKEGADVVARYDITLNGKTVQEGTVIEPDDTVGGMKPHLYRYLDWVATKSGKNHLTITGFLPLPNSSREIGV
jgi:hypothetical protein